MTFFPSNHIQKEEISLDLIFFESDNILSDDIFFQINTVSKSKIELNIT